MKIVLLGPPGSGKGTAGVQIADNLGVPRVVSSELLKLEVRSRSEEGQLIASFIDRGDLVPDELVIKIVILHLMNMSGFVLDGFPRTVKQAQELEKMVEIDKVIYLDTRFKVAKQRNLERKMCKSCGFSPMPKFKTCPRCGGELYKRTDDSEQAIERRFENYLRETSPLIDYYKIMGKLVRIDANEPIGIVKENIFSSLGILK